VGLRLCLRQARDGGFRRPLLANVPPLCLLDAFTGRPLRDAARHTIRPEQAHRRRPHPQVKPLRRLVGVREMIGARDDGVGHLGRIFPNGCGLAQTRLRHAILTRRPRHPTNLFYVETARLFRLHNLGRMLPDRHRLRESLMAYAILAFNL
jgi:hypothetical protein